MDITIKRIHSTCGDIGVTVKEIGGKTFYALCDIMEQMKLKGSICGMERHNPTPIAATIVWDYVVRGNNFLETVFVDEECALNLTQQPLSACEPS